MSRTPVAIIGIGCRFPGKIDGPRAFFELLRRGGDAVTEVPDDRWRVDRFYDPDRNSAGKTVSRWGGFVDHVFDFDAGCFGLSPREAGFMDPQQRLLLEVFWEALEDAGVPVDRIAGTRTGVFVGAFTADAMVLRLGDLGRHVIDVHTATGNMMTLLANRISYLFDLRGPSLVLDTACSSSLVALHLAARSIAAGESELAVAGGVNVMLHPGITIAESRAGMLSPTGRCRAFDASADGYVRAEGAGFVVLKPLERAVRDGDDIYAVIAGSAVNQDGRSAGQTVPSADAQEQLIREACRTAGVDEREIHFVEAHGTGTPVGDPIEATAIGRALGGGRTEPCIVGSVKTNLGHAEGAAGVAGLIKAALAIRHGEIPAHLHVTGGTPRIAFDELGLRLPLELTPWPATSGPRRAGVNSFGFGGTNCHVILEQAPPRAAEPRVELARPSRPQLLALSARSDAALAELAARVADGLDDRGDLARLCAYAARCRGHHDHRLAVRFRDRDELATGLRAHAAGAARDGVTTGRAPATPPRLAMVFSGMGPQWSGMGRTLVEREPVFAAAIAACHDAFARLTDAWSLRAELHADPAHSRITRTEIAQPANFSLQVGLLELFRAFGVEADVFVGHSIGESAAAYAAGALSLDDAAAVVFHRSRLQQRLAGRGTMLAIGLSRGDAEAEIGPLASEIAIAAINSPDAVTLAGSRAALEAVAARLGARGVFARFLQVEVPYHSPLTDPLEHEFVAAVSHIQPRATPRALWSTVTGAQIDGRELDASYWWRNLRRPVDFAGALDSLLASGVRALLEVGPHPVLSGFAAGALAARSLDGTVVGSLKRGQDESDRVLDALGALHAIGVRLDWTELYPRVDRTARLPSYPWQRTHHWVEASQSVRLRRAPADHVLLGRRTEAAVPTWEVELDPRVVPELHDHRIHGAAVFPAACGIEMVLQAARQLYGTTPVVIEAIRFERALVLRDDGAIAVQLVLDPATAAFTAHGRRSAEDPWEAAFSGRLGRDLGARPAPLPHDLLDAARARLASVAPHYAALRERGFDYGPAFRPARGVWASDVDAVVQLRCEPRPEYTIPPTTVDATLQAMLFAGRGAYLPIELRGVRVVGAATSTMWARASVRHRTDEHLQAGVTLYDGDGAPVLEVAEFSGRALPPATDEPPVSVRDWLYEVGWRPEPPPARGAPGRWLVLGDDDRDVTELAHQLRDRGAAVITELDGVAACDAVAWLPGPTSTSIWDHARATIGALLALTTRLDAIGSPAKLWVVTRGATPAGRAPIDLGQSGLVGLARVLANHERTRSWGGLIDLAPDPAIGDHARLADELLAEGPAREVALRDGARLVARLARRTTPAPELPFRCAARGSYLVTGARGSLGSLAAKLLVARGARHVILVVRDELPGRPDWVAATGRTAELIAQVRELEQAGATVHVWTCDVANVALLAGHARAHAQQGLPPVRGVVHTAGVVRDRVHAAVTTDDIEAVLRPKLLGALALDRVFGPELDLFVVFSSLASVLGTAGQATYAAANAFLDALCHQRHRAGRPAQSLNWGPWAEVGMARELGAYFAARGVQSIAPDRGIAVLAELLGDRAPQTVIAPIIPERLGKLYAAAIPAMIAPLVTSAAAVARDAPPDAGAALRDAAAADRGPIAERLLCRLAAWVARQPDDRVRATATLRDLGLDSVMAVELQVAIERAAGVKLSPAELLGGSSIAELAIQVAHRVAAPAPIPAEAYTMTLVGEADPQFAEIRELVHDAYHRAYGADVEVHGHAFVAIEVGGELKSCIALNRADHPLFVEQYLDEPCEIAIGRREHRAVARAELVELASYAARDPAWAIHAVEEAYRIAADRGYAFAVVTATRRIRALYDQWGIEFCELAPATIDRIPADQASRWGTFYDAEPITGYLRIDPANARFRRPDPARLGDEPAVRRAS